MTGGRGCGLGHPRLPLPRPAGREGTPVPWERALRRIGHPRPKRTWSEVDIVSFGAAT